MKNIGIITWHYYGNVGSALQAYALQTLLGKLGYKAEIINYRNQKFGKETILKEKIKHKLSYINDLFDVRLGTRFSYSFLAFRKKYLYESKLIYDSNELRKTAYKYQAIICGSDQIWAPNVFNPVYMINFADRNKTKKISYAASVGLNYIPTKLRDIYKELLNDFHKVSVREETGKKLLKDECGISSTVVLDPTLLLEKSTYQKLQNPVTGIRQTFIFCYFLNNEHQYREQVETYAANKGHLMIGYSAKATDSSWMRILGNMGPCEFLWLIENSAVVFTDSYHGTIFSLLFHKEFWTFERFNTEDPINQNSRIYQLDKTFNIGERIVNNDSVLEDCEKLDYDIFEEILLRKRKSSISFLKGALE